MKRLGQNTPGDTGGFLAEDTDQQVPMGAGRFSSLLDDARNGVPDAVVRFLTGPNPPGRTARDCR
ncbi:hypothetical protein [Streptomyces sp. T028]|uniref:hypothetical protein n=1 Tax=Streptomyces sp. T028 TaxID=3394379 RepID=UPI003A8B213B